ncbi:MAG: 16S rRNA (adenine(1518)-N(6)/adenine(1519)-N(6))-dimethyltransferase RsmA [Patescibacteria group bacterium]
MDRYIFTTIKAKKDFGQNFLTSDCVVDTLVGAADVTRDDTVLEIGPGTGKVTEQLAARGKRVIAVELDRDLIPILRYNLKNSANVEIINDDILNYLRYHAFTKDNVADKIVGSLPFQITSPLLHQIINCPWWKIASLLIQKEVAEKLTAKPPRANYLSNFVQYFVDVKLITTVERKDFFPVPEVDGAIIRLEPKTDNRKEMLDAVKWSHFLHRGFSHPRQMINKAFPSEILIKGGVDRERRPATLTGEEWLKLYKLCLP